MTCDDGINCKSTSLIVRKSRAILNRLNIPLTTFLTALDDFVLSLSAELCEIGWWIIAEAWNSLHRQSQNDYNRPLAIEMIDWFSCWLKSEASWNFMCFFSLFSSLDIVLSDNKMNLWWLSRCSAISVEKKRRPEEKLAS